MTISNRNVKTFAHTKHNIDPAYKERIYDNLSTVINNLIFKLLFILIYAY